MKQSGSLLDCCLIAAGLLPSLASRRLRDQIVANEDPQSTIAHVPTTWATPESRAPVGFLGITTHFCVNLPFSSQGIYGVVCDMDEQLESSRLPLELDEDIIDFIEDRDTPTLKACSLTCRAWLPIARSRLFHRVTLTAPQEWARFERLLVVPSKGSLGSVAPYVRIVILSALHSQVEWGNSRVKAPAHALEFINGRGVNILKSLTHLEQLEISYTVWSPSSAPSPLVGMWEGLLTLSPSITKLSFSEQIEMERDVVWNSGPSSFVPSATSTIRLRDLCMHIPQPEVVLSWFLAPPFEIGFRSLRLGWTDLPEHQRVLKQIILRAGTSLRHLQFRMSHDMHASEPYTGEVDISRNTQLTGLEFHSLYLSRPAVRNNLIWVSTLLSQCRQAYLEWIRLDLLWMELEDVDLLAWNVIDAQLARLAQNNPKLVVIIHVQNLLYRWPAREALDALLVRLPNFRACNTRLGLQFRLNVVFTLQYEEHWFGSAPP
ncbi:hypothetical protein A0H81_02498 [Grifola frondosa]|uniref:F-box domain-containing protein n=1 Tax=Grifola frondosa TaxID=5627 RepID=A0A1C7MKZ4_GRIFR|nr:hypothetical protein A0H81_02498 [Grifola frondosa]